MSSFVFLESQLTHQADARKQIMPHYRLEGPQQGFGAVFGGIYDTICTMCVCLCVSVCLL